MIDVDRVSFEYPGTLALDEVSISVGDGDIAALVGPNGAGKTTLLRCLAALDRPISGAITIDSTDVIEEPRVCHRKVGYLSDFFGLYEDLTGHQCLSYAALAGGIGEDSLSAATGRAAERLHIEDLLDSKASTLSRGQRQRLAIAQAVVHEPKVLILDEPASGLDPEARRDLAALFVELASGGMTLLVSSHILSELEEYSTEMIILDKGRVVSQERVGAAHDLTGTMRITLAEPADGLAERLSAYEGISSVEADKNSALFTYASDRADRHALLKDLITAGLKVSTFSEVKTNMHEKYLSRMTDGARIKDGGDDKGGGKS